MIRENLYNLIPNDNKIIFIRATADEQLSVFYTDADKDIPLQYGRVVQYVGDKPIIKGDIIIYSDYYADDIEDTDGYIASVIAQQDIHAVLPEGTAVYMADN